ncbi:transcriptional regulator, partial [Micromonospora sp. NPDC051296]
YAVDPTPLQELDHWLDRYRGFWSQRLDALGTEIARGRVRRQAESGEGRAGRRPRRQAGDADG